MFIEDTSFTRRGYEWSLYYKEIVLTSESYDSLLNSAYEKGIDLEDGKFLVVEHLKDAA